MANAGLPLVGQVVFTDRPSRLTSPGESTPFAALDAPLDEGVEPAARAIQRTW